jgi:hypothetical protein
MGGLWSTHIDIHFVSALALDGFVQHMLRYILCPHLHGMDLVNTFRSTFLEW